MSIHKLNVFLRTAKRLVLAIIFLVSAFISAHAQTSFQVDDSGSIEDMVKSLAGPNVVISNIRYSGQTNKKPVGSFNDVLGLLDITTGLLMTNGSAKLVIGPNNLSNAGAGAGGSGSDSDLESVVPGEDLFDVVVIEFDIRVTNTVLSFNYMFGSEEYPEYERQYNDVFGFFISGPGITGKKNLAVLSDGTPVSVKSINSVKNTNYFVSNGGGDNPAHDFYLQYDGFTKKLTAKTEVIPCETYHIKLAIADAKDDILDSGVFIEKGSFTSTSKLDIEVAFEHEGYGYAVEGCNKGYFIIKKNIDWIKLNDPVTLEFKLSGSATNGVDYTAVSGTTITIPANEESIKMEINALLDALPEGSETVHIDILLRCGTNILATSSAEMIIKDKIDFPINSVVCKDVSMPINVQTSNRWVFTWAPNAALSCTDCPSPNVKLLTDAQFPVHVRDVESGCETDTEASVTLQNPEAYFTYSKNLYYTSVDAFFKNLSTNADEYVWDFGDGQTSTEFEPIHKFSAGESLDSIPYKISLKIRSLIGCEAKYDTTIVIVPFYAPNVITPNDDPWNQGFVVKGIENGVWKIRIYNRWGTLVYSSNGYNNDWEGNNVSGGVYYFKLRNPPGDREIKGWLHVLK